jgi:hypothetical protein
MINLDEELEPFSGVFGRERGVPLTLQWRTDRGAASGYGLASARSQRHEDARDAVLTAARLAGLIKRSISYSRRPASYAKRQRYYGPSFTYRTIPPAVADGVAAGLLKEQRASPRTRGRQSRFWATPLLLQDTANTPIRLQINETIWLKDHDRRLLDYVETELTRHLRREVGSINHYLADIKVELPGVEHVGPYWLVAGSYLLPTAPHVRRIFNRASFDKGGRLYGWWQALPSDVRLNLSLDCQPALEPDFAQLHPQIIYALRGIRLVGDAYETQAFPRELGKRAFNIALNAGPRGAVGAIANKLNISRSTASLLLTEIKAKHKPVADIFCSDAGVNLMRIDSDITVECLKRCQARDIPALPVHDSLIVPASEAERAAEIMQQAFATRFPHTSCEVRLKNPGRTHLQVQQAA